MHIPSFVILVAKGGHKINTGLALAFQFDEKTTPNAWSKKNSTFLAGCENKRGEAHFRPEREVKAYSSVSESDLLAGGAEGESALFIAFKLRIAPEQAINYHPGEKSSKNQRVCRQMVAVCVIYARYKAWASFLE